MEMRVFIPPNGSLQVPSKNPDPDPHYQLKTIKPSSPRETIHYIKITSSKYERDSEEA